MKTIIAVMFTVALVVAEVPSNSYLPPPPNHGYSQSTPASIVAARTFDQGHHQGDQHAAGGVNGFARSGLNHDHGAHAHGAHDHAGHDHEAQARFNSNEEHGYDQNAAGYARNALDEVNSTVGYEGDERGFNAQTSYEESEELTSSSGYDSNAHNFRANSGYHGNEQDGGHAHARSNGYN